VSACIGHGSIAPSAKKLPRTPAWQPKRRKAPENLMVWLQQIFTTERVILTP
jgi:hypothetical protein